MPYNQNHTVWESEWLLRLVQFAGVILVTSVIAGIVLFFLAVVKFSVHYLIGTHV